MDLGRWDELIPVRFFQYYVLLTSYPLANSILGDTDRDGFVPVVSLSLVFVPL